MLTSSFAGGLDVQRAGRELPTKQITLALERMWCSHRGGLVNGHQRAVEPNEGDQVRVLLGRAATRLTCPQVSQSCVHLVQQRYRMDREILRLHDRSVARQTARASLTPLCFRMGLDVRCVWLGSVRTHGGGHEDAVKNCASGYVLEHVGKLPYGLGCAFSLSIRPLSQKLILFVLVDMRTRRCASRYCSYSAQPLTP